MSRAARARVVAAVEAYAYHMGLSRLRRTPLSAAWILEVRRALTAYARAVRAERARTPAMIAARRVRGR